MFVGNTITESTFVFLAAWQANKSRGKVLGLISSFVPLWTEKIVWFNLLKLVKTVLYHIM